jgi:hypothetical protein
MFFPGCRMISIPSSLIALIDIPNHSDHTFLFYYWDSTNATTCLTLSFTAYRSQLKN